MSRFVSWLTHLQFAQCLLTSIVVLTAFAPYHAHATAECRLPTTRTSIQPHIEVELIAEPFSLDQTQSRVGILFKPEPGWHIYWKNPGDTGLAPEIEWHEGLEVGALNWPTPESIRLADLVDQGYHHDTLLWSDYKLDSGSSVVFASAKWLVCKDECIPGSATLAVDLSTLSDQDEQQARFLFDTAEDTMPRPFPIMDARAEVLDSMLKLSVFATTPKIFEVDAITGEKPQVEVFIENPDLVEYGTPQSVHAVNNMLVWEQALNDFHSSTPEEIQVLIVVDKKDAYYLTVPIQHPSSI